MKVINSASLEMFGIFGSKWGELISVSIWLPNKDNVCPTKELTDEDYKHKKFTTELKRIWEKFHWIDCYFSAEHTHYFMVSSVETNQLHPLLKHIKI